MTDPTVIEKVKLFVMKMSDTCTFSDSWLQNFKEPANDGDIQMEYSSYQLHWPSKEAGQKNYP